MELSGGSSDGGRGPATLLVGSLALVLALFAHGLAFLTWEAAGLLLLAVVAIVSAVGAPRLLRTPPTSVLAGLAAVVGAYHLVSALWSVL